LGSSGVGGVVICSVEGELIRRVNERWRCGDVMIGQNLFDFDDVGVCTVVAGWVDVRRGGGGRCFLGGVGVCMCGAPLARESVYLRLPGIT